MRAKNTRGYVLKVAVASASIGCVTLACEAQHPVGSVAAPPQIDAGSSEPVTTAASPPVPQPPEVGTVAHAPDAPDASAPPKPTAHKVGIVAAPPDVSPVVGTTAHAPDHAPPKK